MKTKTHWLMWITTTRVGRGKVWSGCAHTLDLSGISCLSLATFRQCSPVWPGLFRSLFFVLVFWQTELVQPRLSAEHCIWAQTECSAVFDLRSIFFFFSKWFEHSWSWCFCSHNTWNDNSVSFVSFSQQPTACSTLARHASLSIRCYWAMRVSCLVVTSRRTRDRNPGFSTADTAAGQKRRVCFFSIQHFYVPQENVHVSNEQRVC